MKNIKYILFSLFLLIPFSVNANSISDINMDIVLDQNGTATITETWKADVSQGTEGWHPYFDLGDSKIYVVSASMDEKKYSINSNWNENASLSDKAYKVGIYKSYNDQYKQNETDIVFGISNYGNHTYTIVYKITNFVRNLNDSDIAYWQLFPYDFSAEPDNVSIKITGPNYFDENKVDVWSYGYYGSLCYVKDGAIYLTSEGTLSTSEYLALLAKFPKNTFQTTSKIEKDFNYYLDLAEKGAEHYKDPDETSLFSKIVSFLMYAGIPLAAIIGGIFVAKGTKYGYKDNKTIDKKNTPMFRDIPCDKDIYYANALINLNNFGYKEGNILGAIILKWVKQKKILFIKPKEGLFNSKTGSIDMTKDATFDNELESELFNLMRAASGDGILEAKELEKWCRSHYQKFLNLFDKIKNQEITKLKSANHIYTRQNKKECKYKNVMDDKIYEDSKQLYGLKLYLQEFSKMDTKEVMEVHLWDEYLMFAYLFGIADKVAKQLKNLYPDALKMEQQDIYLDYGTLMFINNISSSSVHAASAARSAAESYSGGGGGFGSGGGGFGSFGGGGGGGGFR